MTRKNILAYILAYSAVEKQYPYIQTVTMKGNMLLILLFVAYCQAAVVMNDDFHSSNRIFSVEADSAWPPKFCNKLDCPKFTVVNSTKNYEVRQYEASGWVTTQALNIDYDDATHDMFMRLFHYISGNNSASEKIAMTAPVINRVIPGQGPACENNFTMSFFLAPSVKNPPQPSDPQVYLSKLPGQTVYVRSFGGFAKQADYLKNAQELAAALPSSATYNKDYFYTAGYDAPFKLFGRHNEVWFIGQ